MDLGKAKLDLEINANGAVRQFLCDVIAEFQKMLAEFDARQAPRKGDAEAATEWCESPATTSGARKELPALPPELCGVSLDIKESGELWIGTPDHRRYTQWSGPFHIVSGSPAPCSMTPVPRGMYRQDLDEELKEWAERQTGERPSHIIHE